MNCIYGGLRKPLVLVQATLCGTRQLLSVHSSVLSLRLSSYNEVNQTHACSNAYTLNNILKTEVSCPAKYDGLI